MRYALFIMMLGVAISTSLPAQDKPLPPPKTFSPETRSATDVLPALLLPEYVITGSDMISFTEDRKSALAEPDSRAFTARAGRGVREQRFFDTAPTRMPLQKPLLTGSEERFLLKAGYGNFATPHIQLWYGDRYRLGDAAAHLLYESSEGHVSHADYMRFGFDASGGTYLPKHLHPLLSASRLQASFHTDVQEYGLYADKLDPQVPQPDFRRNLVDMDGRIDLLSRRNRVLDHQLSLVFGHTDLEEDFGLRDTTRFTEYQAIESRFGIEAATTLHETIVPLDLRMLVHVNDLGDSDPGATRPFFIETGAAGHYKLSDGLWLDGDLALFHYRGSDHASQFRLYPSISVRYLHDEAWTFHAGYIPDVAEQTFSGFRRRNPYLMLASEIRHTDVPIRIEAGAAFDDRRSTSGRIRLSYLRSASWARFSLLPDPVQQQWNILYNGWSSIGELQGDLAHAFSSRTRLQSRAVFRFSGSEDYDGGIPYLPDYEVRILLEHDFPFDLTLQATAQVVGERSTGSDEELAAWMLLGMQLEYRFMNNAGLFLRADNLLDQKYQLWNGYRERPFFILGGLIFRF